MVSGALEETVSGVTRMLEKVALRYVTCICSHH